MELVSSWLLLLGVVDIPGELRHALTLRRLSSVNGLGGVRTRFCSSSALRLGRFVADIFILKFWD